VDNSQNNGFVSRLQIFVGELKRRKVFQVTSIYLVAAWGLSAGAADIFDIFEFPSWASRYFVIVVFSLTPLVVVIAWVFELNKSGLQRDVRPNNPVDQTTILANRKDLPAISATWRGKKHNFVSEFIVGRDDGCAMQIIDPLVSRQHAKLQYVAGRWKIEDLGSANGIVVNGTKVQSAWLEHDSSVRFYPQGPELLLTIGSPSTAETKLAQEQATLGTQT